MKAGLSILLTEMALLSFLFFVGVNPASLIIFSIILLYPTLLILLLCRAWAAKDKLNRIALIVIAVLLVVIPFGDIPFDKYRFNKLCQEEAGIFVYKKVGLPQEFYLTPGELTKKVVTLSDGYKIRKLRPAVGNELRIEKLKECYAFEARGELVDVGWGGVYKSTLIISSSDEPLGKAVSIRGGAGWFFERYSPGAGRPGGTCLKELRKPSYGGNYENLPYDIFYKLETEGVVENGNTD